MAKCPSARRGAGAAGPFVRSLSLTPGPPLENLWPEATATIQQASFQSVLTWGVKPMIWLSTLHGDLAHHDAIWSQEQHGLCQPDAVRSPSTSTMGSTGQTQCRVWLEILGTSSSRSQNDRLLESGRESEDVWDYPFVNTLGTHYMAARARVELACDTLRGQGQAQVTKFGICDKTVTDISLDKVKVIQDLLEDVREQGDPRSIKRRSRTLEHFDHEDISFSKESVSPGLSVP